MRSAQLDHWDWLGQPLAMDLANSLPRIRPGETRDLLASEDDLERWLANQGDRLPRLGPAPDRLAAFRELRDTLHDALTAAADGDPLPPRATQALNAASARSDGHVRLRVSGGAPKAELTGSGTPLDRTLSTIARSGIELLASPDRERLRVCAAPSCGFFFFGRPDQEWCSIACGNRARAARHYARRRASSG
jgi:predicted RNA-binding Zn ribbon-like protein